MINTCNDSPNEEERQIEVKPSTRPRVILNRIFARAIQDTTSDRCGQESLGKKNVKVIGINQLQTKECIVPKTNSNGLSCNSERSSYNGNYTQNPKDSDKNIQSERIQTNKHSTQSLKDPIPSLSPDDFILSKRNQNYSTDNKTVKASVKKDLYSESVNKLQPEEVPTCSLEKELLSLIPANCSRLKSNLKYFTETKVENVLVEEETNSMSIETIQATKHHIQSSKNICQEEYILTKRSPQNLCSVIKTEKISVGGESHSKSVGKDFVNVDDRHKSILSFTTNDTRSNMDSDSSSWCSVSSMCEAQTKHHNTETTVAEIKDCNKTDICTVVLSEKKLKNGKPSLKIYINALPVDPKPLFDDLEGHYYIAPPQPLSAVVDATDAGSEIYSIKANGHSSFNDIASSNLSSKSIVKSPTVLDESKTEKITHYLKSIEMNKAMSIDITNKVLADIRKVLNYYFKGNVLLLYGSYLSGIAVTTSNVNLALKPEHIPNNKFLLQFQKNIAKDLVHYRVEPLEEDPNPKKSKICFTEPENGISCEIMYLGKSVAGYRDISRLLKEVCQYDERIRSLIVCTRIWAEVCALHEPENGKLHPLGFTLLVIHFLQRMENPLLPVINIKDANWGLTPLTTKNNSSVGKLWLDFLNYYTDSFNWKDTVVSIQSKSMVSKKSKDWDRSWIAIEDPCSHRNVAGSVVNIECAECIFECFKATFQYFSTSTSNGENDSFKSDIIDDKRDLSSQFDYSFDDIAFELTCEDSDEINSDCENAEVRTKLASLSSLPKLSESSMGNVETTLLEVYKEFVLPEPKVNGRKAFVRDLEAYIQKKFPRAKLTLFGSSVNEFGFKNSDLDICMTFKDLSRKHCNESSVLKSLTYHLRKNKSCYKDIIGLYAAQIPIVKFVFISEGWNCDISLYNVLGVHNSKLLSTYALIDERCKILGCALKLLAKKACLADCTLKSLSSYSYLLMVIHYLQQTEPPVLPVLPVDDKEAFEKIDVTEEVLKDRNEWYHWIPNQLRNRFLNSQEKNNSSVGELWLGLLEFYLKYDCEQAITITQKEPMLASSLPKIACLYNIADPFIDKNLGCIVSEKKSEETIRIFNRARMLFGKEIPKDHLQNPKDYYFSSSNLTGRFVKEVECLACGNFGHEKGECSKGNPFKHIKLPSPKQILGGANNFRL